jgi:hypothetical protein
MSNSHPLNNSPLHEDHVYRIAWAVFGAIMLALALSVMSYSGRQDEASVVASNNAPDTPSSPRTFPLGNPGTEVE